MERLEQNNFIHYEISNFCTEGNYSNHNTSYWSGAKYLGIGPSATPIMGFHGNGIFQISTNTSKVSILV